MFPCKRLVFLACFLFPAVTIHAQTSIFGFGSSWKYLITGTDQGTAWRGTGFSDAAWPSGSGELGYGDGGETTVIGYGPSASSKYITTYFRKTISIANVAAYASFTMNVRRDDGVVVYVNGTEVYRNNMPAGAIAYTTLASTPIGDADETTPVSVTLPITNFVSGSNVIAVEIHQVLPSSSDLSFDLSLTGTIASNQPPTANAGADQTITLTANSVSLSGTGTDPGGTISSYNWTKISGPSDGTITNPASPSTTVTGLTQGVYIFRLTVTDNNGATGTDDVQVTVNAAANQLPAANAGADQTITLPANSVSLIGSGTDPDGIISSYSWSKLSGPSGGTITSPASPSTTVTGLTQGVYIFRLTVTDNNGAMGTDDVQVTVNAAANQPPTANAGADQTITLPANSVTLSGSGTDSDGTISTYAWSKLSGPTGSAITSPASAGTTVTGLTEGVYVFRLTVTDNNGATGTDDVQVTVNAAVQAPATIFGFGSLWKYLDNGSNQGTAWRGAAFIDATWAGGNGQFGYGDGDETTIVSFGPILSAKYTTTYFRKTINITSISAYTNFTMQLRRDDGVVVYINGAEVYRNNMPAGTIGHTTFAVSPIGGADENNPLTVQLPTSFFLNGSNIIAVEMHQSDLTSSDLTFDMSLTGTISSNPPPNQPPSANAGADQTITLPANSITLTGSGADPDGTISSYSWSKLSGPAEGTITSPSSASTTITGLAQGVYIFRLTVTDNSGATGTDDIQITVNAATNQPPSANAGPDQTLTLPANSITLTGSGSDPDGTISSYSWSKLSGPSGGVIASPASASTTVTGLAQGVYIFRLTVTDNSGSTGTDDIQITVNAATNQPPSANAGADQIITLPANSITLTGSGSDPDGTISSYSWSKLNGPPGGTIASPASSSTTVTGLVQGVYIFRLTVTDNNGATAADDVQVTVNEAAPSPQTIFGFGSSWKYLDNGSNQGTAWRATGFDDAPWKTGNAQLGYGDGDEATIVSYGPSATNKYTTTYFRKTVNIPNVSAYTSFTMQVKRDDGIVVYVNGTELYRNNMPSGSIAYNTFASAVVGGADESTPLNVTISPAVFVNGNNVIAAEVHQVDLTSSDLTFDMSLAGPGSSGGTANVTRGPYLQMGNQTAVTIKWRTDVAGNSRVYYGTSPGNLTSSADDAASTTEHTVRVTGLAPDTKYYYGIGTTTAMLASGNDFYFKTAPPATSTRKIRVAAFGDCGRNDNGFQSGTLSAYRNFIGSNETDLWLLMGDNAYDDGTDTEFTSNFFNPYGSTILRNHMLFPSPGNHDYADDGGLAASKNIPYYSIFNLPANAECDGVASGTESYYSFDYGPIHFLSLDSYGKENGGTTNFYDTLGAQATWVKQDLAATDKKWIIAYWHHPPYCKGSHDSDTENDLIAIRQKFIRILERYGVDMVITGHSHDYERSYLLKGHFGVAGSFNPSVHAISNSSGRYNNSSNSCPYYMPPGKVNHGTVYVVSGSAGADGPVMSGQWPMAALPFAQDDGGAFYFEIEDNRLDAKFIRKDGVIADQFSIMKDVNKSSAISISNGATATLTASYIGNYNWSGGTASGNTRSINVTQAANSTVTYHVRDGFNCLDDVFTVTSSGSTGQPASVFGFGSNWKYYDKGADPGSGWRTAGFSDASWASGNGQFGYGDGDETTIVSYGPSASNKYTTTYFRKPVNITDVSAYSSFTMQVRRDDGVIVYINGTEVFRNNMPGGSVGYSTFASAPIGGSDESTPLSVTISANAFVNGNNIIAVEMHQSDLTSSDLTFDMSLTGVLNSGNQANRNTTTISEPITDKYQSSFNIVLANTFNGLQFRISSYNTQKFQVRLADITGRIVYRKNTGITAGSFYSDQLLLRPGIYVLEIINEKGERVTNKVVIR